MIEKLRKEGKIQLSYLEEENKKINKNKIWGELKSKEKKGVKNIMEKRETRGKFYLLHLGQIIVLLSSCLIP